MTAHLRQALFVAGFGVLAALAVAGWTRKPSTASAYSAEPYAAPAYAGNPPAEATAPQPAYNYDSELPSYAESHYVRVVRPTEPPQEPAQLAPAGPASASPVPPPDSRVVRRYPRRVRERSWKKSAAIVGGSAGVGAAIGALAGGGEGAGIGALAGGAGGFVYDRLTHKHVQ